MWIMTGGKASMTRTNWIVTVAAAAIAGAGIGAVATHAALGAENSNLPWQTDVAGGAPS